jgi:predicted nucleic acid-binding Zn ribbon protein
MPKFDYSCECGTEFEREIPYGSKLRPRCPGCRKGKTVKKKIGVIAIKFVGSGFTKSVYDEDDHIAD